MKPLRALTALAALAVSIPAHAQVDPGVMPQFLVLDLDDGSLVAEVTVTETRPGTADGYTFVGEEAWHWVDEPWPAQALLLRAGEGSGAEADAVYHQALFPEEPSYTTLPDGDQTYAVTRLSSGEALGWLVVDDAEDPGSALTWALLDEAEVGELLDLDEDAIVLEPDAAPGEPMWLRIIAQSEL